MKKILVMVCALGLATTVACGDDDDNGNNGTNNPTNNATNNGTNNPTNNGTNNPTNNGTNNPTNNGTNNPTNNATNNPTNNETNAPFEPCADYCTTFAANCATEFGTDYTDEAGCLTACAAFTVGTEADTTGDTAGCRLYHATAAATDAAVHCPHAALAPTELCVAE